MAEELQTVQSTETPPEEENRNLVGGLLQKLRGAVSSTQQVEAEQPVVEDLPQEPAPQPEEAQPDVPSEEDFEKMLAELEQEGELTGEAEQEQPQEQQAESGVTEAEIQAAAAAIVQAIRTGSDQFGIEISDQRAMEIALTVIAQASSVEQAELLVLGLLAKEAQRQGVGATRNVRREFEGSSEDTLALFVRLAS